MKNQLMSDAERMFVHTVMFQAGIVPMENAAMDVRRALQDVDPDAARKLKRKFRKLWRKAMRAKLVSNPIRRAEVVIDSVTKKGAPPTRRQKLHRKQIVTEALRPAVDGLMQQFKTIKREEG